MNILKTVLFSAGAIGAAYTGALMLTQTLDAAAEGKRASLTREAVLADAKAALGEPSTSVRAGRVAFSAAPAYQLKDGFGTTLRRCVGAFAADPSQGQVMVVQSAGGNSTFDVSCPDLLAQAASASFGANAGDDVVARVLPAQFAASLRTSGQFQGSVGSDTPVATGQGGTVAWSVDSKNRVVAAYTDEAGTMRALGGRSEESAYAQLPNGFHPVPGFLPVPGGVLESTGQSVGSFYVSQRLVGESYASAASSPVELGSLEWAKGVCAKLRVSADGPPATAGRGGYKDHAVSARLITDTEYLYLAQLAGQNPYNYSLASGGAPSPTSDFTGATLRHGTYTLAAPSSPIVGVAISPTNTNGHRVFYYMPGPNTFDFELFDLSGIPQWTQGVLLRSEMPAGDTSLTLPAALRNGAGSAGIPKAWAPSRTLHTGGTATVGHIRLSSSRYECRNAAPDYCESGNDPALSALAVVRAIGVNPGSTAQASSAQVGLWSATVVDARSDLAPAVPAGARCAFSITEAN